MRNSADRTLFVHLTKARGIMNAIRRCWHLLFPALCSWLQAINGRRRALTERFRFGIASRLVVAFICVVALVLAANFIVQQGVLIEKTTQITQIAPPPAIAAAQ